GLIEPSRRRSRENHMDVNMMDLKTTNKEDENNSPIERVSAKQGELNEELEIVQYKKEVKDIGTSLDAKHRPSSHNR
ncbi:hypothetical protein, partial [Mycobacterium tuberculosis]